MKTPSRTTRARLAVVLASATLVAVAGTTAAYSAGLIGSADIKDNSVQSKDIKNKTLKMQDLTTKLKSKVNATTPGPKGPAGPQGPAGPAGDSGVVKVRSLGGLWSARATDVAGIRMIGDGVQSGPLSASQCATPGVDYTRLDFSGLNGQPLANLKSLVFTDWYVADNDTSGIGSPSLRIQLGADRLTFSANTQFNKPFQYDDEQGEVNTHLVTSGTVRLNDDAGSNPAGEAPFTSYLPTLGSRTITGINILSGCGAGDNLTTLIRSAEVNGTTYDFGS